LSSSPTQINRPFRVKTSLGDDALLLDTFTGSERVSTPFHFALRVLSSDPNVDMQSLLTGPVVLTLKLDDNTERHIHGNIRAVKLLEVGADNMAAYELDVVAWPWFLNLFANCQIFQNKSVPDIVQQIFTNRGFTDYVSRLQGTYSPLEYCVQYRETDFNFISRLLESEGIFYFFEQSEDKHTMVLADDPSAFAALPDQSTVRFMPSEGAFLDDEIIATLETEYRLEPGTSSLTDYDFTKPNTGLYATLAGTQEGEIFEYPGKYTSKDDGDHYARIHLEEYEAGISTVRGLANCMAFQCGYKFTLSDYYRDSGNIDYTLLALEHSGRNASFQAGNMIQPFEYSNRFEAIPNSVVFRPPRRARKPLIEGTQTAVVVGKSGEEIWTDQYGRIKVQFFWDRVGTMDENSSCWIRVAQPWAGKNWGFITLPRMGQEVLVTFLEGDPDRPLITGSVYNGEQMPPYTLPDYQTKSTWKSLTTKGGGGFNEIRFEDNSGSEQIFINGQKNLDIRIKNDEYKTIENNINLTVTKDRYEHIKNDHHTTVDNDMYFKAGRDHHFTIAGKQAIKVTGSHSFQVTGAVTEVFSDSHSESVSMNLYLKSGTGMVLEDAVGITLKCGSNCVVIDPTGVTITGSLVTINGQLTKINSGPGSPAMSGTPGQAVSPTAPTDSTDADQADPGQMAQIQAQQQQTGKGKYGSISPAVFKPPTPAQQAAAQQAAAAASPSQAGAPAPPPPPQHYIEITLVDQENNPIPGEPYQITLPDGSTVASGTLDAKGYARVDGIDPGQCKVTFPNRDKSVWKPK
jgi:type VI secretion system secreted protein VgrG